MAKQTGASIGIDRAAILAEVYKRNSLRIEAQLPRLDIRREFEHTLRVRAWRLHCDRHHDRVRQEVLERQRLKFGPDWPSSWGGGVGLNVLMQQALRASFRRPV